MNFFRRFISRRAGSTSATIDSITFDTPGWTPTDSGQQDVRFWEPSWPGRLSLHFIPQPPGIKLELEDPDLLWRQCWAVAAESGGGLVEARPIEVDDVKGTAVIYKYAMDPSGRGRVYVGVIALPLEDCGFVIRVEAPEEFPTGIRESIVINDLLQRGALQIEGDRGDGEVLGPDRMKGWRVRVVDDSIPPHMQPNVSEQIEYDPRFPDHPLSRVRSALDVVLGSVEIVRGGG